ncbi:predicted protein [Histoplasma capsulatum var. duboisii H88]|uniref:Predicted protein n=1 Tax=Ajellomyces capsulatus (strain H88) TaxID=544711 RepID=F0UJR4_AJEC8|nr:predicted protein [Histoplasma capsulatum var. duboisii H88]
MFIPVDDDSTQNVFRLPEKLALPTLIDRGVSPCHCALMPPGQVSPSESDGVRLLLAEATDGNGCNREKKRPGQGHSCVRLCAMPRPRSGGPVGSGKDLSSISHFGP